MDVVVAAQDLERLLARIEDLDVGTAQVCDDQPALRVYGRGERALENRGIGLVFGPVGKLTPERALPAEIGGARIRMLKLNARRFRRVRPDETGLRGRCGGRLTGARRGQHAQQEECCAEGPAESPKEHASVVETPWSRRSHPIPPCANSKFLHPSYCRIRKGNRRRK